MTTRELLKFGLRSNVDSCTFQLVKSQEIVRVARGVFHVAGRTKAVVVEEVAEVKARAFNRKIMKDANRVAEELELSPKKQIANRPHSFQIDGRSSSFKCGPITIKFRGTSKKNFAIGDTLEGQALRALQATGRSVVTPDIFERTMQKLPLPQQISLLNYSSFLSAWLNDLLLRWYFNAIGSQKTQQITSVVITRETDRQPNNTNVVSEYTDASYDTDKTKSLVPKLRSHQARYTPRFTVISSEAHYQIQGSRFRPTALKLQRMQEVELERLTAVETS